MLHEDINLDVLLHSGELCNNYLVHGVCRLSKNSKKAGGHDSLDLHEHGISLNSLIFHENSDDSDDKAWRLIKLLHNDYEKEGRYGLKAQDMSMVYCHQAYLAEKRGKSFDVIYRLYVKALSNEFDEWNVRANLHFADYLLRLKLKSRKEKNYNNHNNNNKPNNKNIFDSLIIKHFEKAIKNEHLLLNYLKNDIIYQNYYESCLRRYYQYRSRDSMNLLLKNLTEKTAGHQYRAISAIRREDNKAVHESALGTAPDEDDVFSESNESDNDNNNNNINQLNQLNQLVDTTNEVTQMVARAFEEEKRSEVAKVVYEGKDDVDDVDVEVEPDILFSDENDDEMNHDSSSLENMSSSDHDDNENNKDSSDMETGNMSSPNGSITGDVTTIGMVTKKVASLASSSTASAATHTSELKGSDTHSGNEHSSETPQSQSPAPGTPSNERNTDRDSGNDADKDIPDDNNKQDKGDHVIDELMQHGGRTTTIMPAINGGGGGGAVHAAVIHNNNNNNNNVRGSIIAFFKSMFAGSCCVSNNNRYNDNEDSDIDTQDGSNDRDNDDHRDNSNAIFRSMEMETTKGQGNKVFGNEQETLTHEEDLAIEPQSPQS